MNSLHDFAYDAFQSSAIDALDGDTSVLVAAPTGAGKTVIADHVIARALSQGEHVIYTAPIKALSNQKYREFSAQYDDLVGIVTGDVAINARAPVRIMTTEIYRNTLLDQPDNVRDAAWVIFDEVHYLDDVERGTVWEEAMILTPPATRMLCLSATVPNIDELAAWMNDVLRRPTVVVTEERRPVPLHFRFQCQGEVFDSWKDVKRRGYKVSSLETARGRGLPRHPRRMKRMRRNRLTQLIQHILRNDELPCIYFAFSRRRTEELAQEVAHMPFLRPREQQRLDTRYVELCRKYGLMSEPSAKRLRKLIRAGVAYHHAGMLPTLKEVVEQLFTARLVPLIFTTETFALGINMPARTVVFDTLRKYYATGFDVLRARDFYQMAGRAGRRGMDDEGFVYVRLVVTRVKPSEVAQTIFGEHEPVISRFNASYATVLNLYDTHGEKMLALYPQTFHCFQASKRRRKLARKRFAARLDLLKEIGCIRRDRLTVKGHFARWMFGHELYLAELFESGLLDRFTPRELCFALSCLVFEPRRGMGAPRKQPKQFMWIERELKRAHRRIHAVETRYDIEPCALPPHPHMGAAIDAWLKGADFSETVEKSGLDEGELVRCLRMVIQLLRQLIQAPYTSDKLRATARDARRLVNRDVVDAERQLRA